MLPHLRASRGLAWAGICIVFVSNACLCGSFFRGDRPRLPHPPDPPPRLANLTPTMGNARAESVCSPARCPHNTDTPRRRWCYGGRHRPDCDTEHRGEYHRARISYAWGLLRMLRLPRRCDGRIPRLPNTWCAGIREDSETGRNGLRRSQEVT